MPTKEQLSLQLNEILGLTEDPIGFEKLTKEELERLVETFSTVAQVAQIGIRSAKEKLRGGLLGKPVGEVLSMPVLDVLLELREQGGVVGLLDRIGGVRRRSAKTRKS